MNCRSDETVSEDMARRKPANRVAQNPSLTPQPRYLLVAWILLLLLGAFFLFASVSDLASDARMGLPSDHLEAFHTIAGVAWTSAKLSSPRITQYVTLLEVTYAVHELVFGLLFLLIVAIPFRRRSRWAWLACWIPMLANLTYTFAIAHYSPTTLVYSLIADMALPVAAAACACFFRDVNAPLSFIQAGERSWLTLFIRIVHQAALFIARIAS